ncbi:acetyl-CoA carboxylase biotin carboxylase subunit [Fodinicola feengrottensis]|uniref:biotin carboxylase n=1 Tax=Fodinicola feengrottensis TaxID=435914 RepID=A0ABN2I951_9ACTN
MFSSVLIANRGEIALRVARTCRELGIRVIAVYSTADRDTAVVRFADEAVHIGPPTHRRSYLNVPAIIEAALCTGAEAIHPGYGFLSEDPDFAEICAQNGIAFVGPPPESMALLGDKARTRALMTDAGLPLLPGSRKTLDSADEALRFAESVGFPVIVKPAAGGGGRGMAIVRDAGSFSRAYLDCQANAQAVFGDRRVYVERFLDQARHVEIQVLRDAFGHAVSLGERDCSVQRRHQKLIEETPAPDLPADLLARMGRAAVSGAAAAGLIGAGTFEFLVDERGDFFFMEINGRIQVEHPVTEMVTGVDIVAEQLNIAAGRRMALRQQDVVPRGVSIECRVVAEDPARGFLPTPATLTEFEPPGGPFVRVDTHGYPGWSLGPDYDSLLAKVVVWAPTRAAAIARMDRALGEFRVTGPGLCTTIEFLRGVLADPLFVGAKHTTALIDHLTRM